MLPRGPHQEGSASTVPLLAMLSLVSGLRGWSRPFLRVAVMKQVTKSLMKSIFNSFRNHYLSPYHVPAEEIQK